MSFRMIPWQALRLSGWYICWNGGIKLKLHPRDLWYLANDR